MATPIVAGLVALIKSANKALDNNEIKDAIMKHGTHHDSLKGVIKSGQVINVKSTLEAL